MQRTRRPTPFVCGARVLAACLLLACTGSIAQEGRAGGEAGRGGGGAGRATAGRGGSGGGGADVVTDVPPPEQACKPGAVRSGPASWRRLTATQYRNTIKDLVGVDADVGLFLSDTTTGSFVTNAGTATPDAQLLKYQDAANRIAADATKDLPRLLGCNPANDGEDACARKFIDDFGGRAWRRPLTDDDRTLLDRVYRAGKQESFAAGIRLVVEGLLQSPSFLYLVEVGATPTGGVARLGGYELASKLSYALWDTMPDAELFEAARKGELGSVDGLRKQADRLLASPRFLTTATGFHEQLLGTTLLGKTAGGVSRDAKLFTAWSPDLAAAMREETRRFVSYVLTKGTGTLSELLSAEVAFPTGPLTALYGAGDPDADGKVAVRDGTRHGLLTQAAMLTAAVPQPTPYQAVLRGKLVRTRVLCSELPPPPGNVQFKPPPNADQLSQQELLRAHQDNPTCKGCHEQMDPIGFGLETYDLIGRHRTTDGGGQRIDASGTLVETDVNGAFADTAGLVDKLAASKMVRGCFARQWFRYVAAREPATDDVCTLSRVQDALSKGGGSLREALRELIVGDSIRYRGGL